MLEKTKQAISAALKTQSVPVPKKPPKDASLRERISSWRTRMGIYAVCGAGIMSMTPAPAFAAGSSLDITSLGSILDFAGNICVVAGFVIAGWNVVKVSQTMKEQQGMQMDNNIWGVIGGIGMAVGGAAIKAAANEWRY